MSGHEYSCHVRFSDVDVYGHVNNVKYFEYYQEARIDFLTGVRAEAAPHLPRCSPGSTWTTSGRSCSGQSPTS